LNITEKLFSMAIEPQSLSTCEVAPDGSTIILGFTDPDGTPAQIRLSLNEVGGLAMTLPDLITKALRLRYGDHTLRYAYPLASWTVERSSDPRTGMMTLCTTDGFSVCFSMPRDLQRKLADALASDGPYEAQMVTN
jgi:hypothetical protein